MSQSGKIVVAMSGGVDSSVAAGLLKKEGMQVEGVILRMHDAGMSQEDIINGKLSQSIRDAREVARKLKIGFSIEDCRREFKEEVISYFVNSYKECLTPNPCAFCNSHVKIKKIIELADKMGAEKIASGHYASVEYDTDRKRYVIKKGIDKNKDQSYMLCDLSQEQLSRLVLPLGGYTKPQIRKLAEDFAFRNANAAESQDICFLPEGNYGAFIEEYLKNDASAKEAVKPGNFIDSEGNILGQHKGLIYYTIGQRKGLGLSLSEPMYVCRKDKESNSVVLCRDEELYSHVVRAAQINLVGTDDIPESGLEISAKIRYSQDETRGIVRMKGDIMEVEFKEAVRAAAPGQKLVLYDGDVLLAGGTII